MPESPTVAVGTGTLDERPPHVPSPLRGAGFWPRRVAPRWRYVLLRRFLACADVSAALLATVSLVVIGSGDAGQLAWGLFYLPAWIVVAKLLGLYDRDERALRHLTVDEIPQLVLAALVGIGGLALFLELMPPGRPNAESALIAAFVAGTSVVALRAGARWLWRILTPAERVAIVGAKGNVGAVRRKLELFPDLHMRIVEERDTREMVADHAGEWLVAVDRLILAPASLDEASMRVAIDTARTLGATLSIVPPGRGVFSSVIRLNHVADLPVLEYRTGDLSRSTMFLKRVLDIGVSASALVVLAPLLVAIAVAIKVNTRGPVLFSQWCAGRGGRAFRMHKFRTMIPNAEELLPQIVRVEELTEPVFKLERDPRATRVGRWLRRWSLDELPQFFNVLKGDMSLVGPRPEQVELVDRYTPEQRVRLLVKPGLTGPMQVYGRAELALDERMAVESDYIENISLGRDFRLLGMTAAAVFRGRGAF